MVKTQSRCFQTSRCYYGDTYPDDQCLSVLDWFGLSCTVTLIRLGEAHTDIHINAPKTQARQKYQIICDEYIKPNDPN